MGSSYHSNWRSTGVVVDWPGSSHAAKSSKTDDISLWTETYSLSWGRSYRLRVLNEGWPRRRRLSSGPLTICTLPNLLAMSSNSSKCRVTRRSSIRNSTVCSLNLLLPRYARWWVSTFIPDASRTLATFLPNRDVPFLRSSDVCRPTTAKISCNVSNSFLPPHLNMTLVQLNEQ